MRDALRIQAEMMLAEAGQIASLRVPATVMGREDIIAEAALAICIDRLIDEAGDRARVMHCLANVIVNRGRQNGLGFGEIADAVLTAVADKCEAKAAQEIEEANRKAEAGKQRAEIETAASSPLIIPAKS